jgi:hypothetical protein
MLFPRSLIVNLNVALKNPSRPQLISIINILIQNDETMPVTIRYTDLENNVPLITDRITGRIPNIRIIDDLCINGFYDREIIRNKLKPQKN